jgi:hypothetical protein
MSDNIAQALEVEEFAAVAVVVMYILRPLAKSDTKRLNVLLQLSFTTRSLPVKPAC